MNMNMNDKVLELKDKSTYMTFDEKHPWLDKVLDYIPYRWRIYHKYCDIKRWFKDKYQLMIKGYADSETWSLDYSLAKWIIPRLKHLRDHTHGTPPNADKILNDAVNPEENYLTTEEWTAKLNEMIYAFEFTLNEDEILNKCYPADYDFGFTTDEKTKQLIWNDTRKPDYTYYDECLKRQKLGLTTFSVYYNNLWD